LVEAELNSLCCNGRVILHDRNKFEVFEQSVAYR